MSNSLPEGWSSVKLSEITDVVSGGTPSRDVAEFWAPADIDWVTPTDITKDSKRALNESSEKISFKGLRNSSAKTLPVGTILMTSRATLGEMKIAEIECCTNQGFKSLIVKPNVDNWFLYYQMKRKKSCYERLGIGSTFLEVNKKDTDNFEVELAPFKQQQKIAKILTTVDNLIDQTQSLIDKYTAVKLGMMADLFSRGIDLSGTPETNKNYGQLRPRYKDAPELYHETEIGWVPLDWTFNQLGSYIEKYLYGPRFDASMYSEYGNVKTIRGTDFSKQGDIKYEQVPLAEIPFPKIRHHILKDGDLVVVTTADCGLTAVYEEQSSDYIPSAYAVKIKLTDDATPYFIKAYMQTFLAETQVNKYVRQGTLGNLPGSDILRFHIALPSLKEQKAMVERLNSIDKLIEKEKQYVEKLKLKKKGLMQDLLTGKVKV